MEAIFLVLYIIFWIGVLVSASIYAFKEIIETGGIVENDINTTNEEETVAMTGAGRAMRVAPENAPTVEELAINITDRVTIAPHFAELGEGAFVRPDLEDVTPEGIGVIRRAIRNYLGTLNRVPHTSDAIGAIGLNLLNRIAAAVTSGGRYEDNGGIGINTYGIDRGLWNDIESFLEEYVNPASRFEPMAVDNRAEEDYPTPTPRPENPVAWTRNTVTLNSDTTMTVGIDMAEDADMPRLHVMGDTDERVDVPQADMRVTATQIRAGTPTVASIRFTTDIMDNDMMVTETVGQDRAEVARARPMTDVQTDEGTLVALPYDHVVEESAKDIIYFAIVDGLVEMTYSDFVKYFGNMNSDAVYENYGWEIRVTETPAQVAIKKQFQWREW